MFERRVLIVAATLFSLAVARASAQESPGLPEDDGGEAGGPPPPCSTGSVVCANTCEVVPGSCRQYPPENVTRCIITCQGRNPR